MPSPDQSSDQASLTYPCPNCGKPVPLHSAERPSTAPFCSVRCRNIDAGAWSDGAYALSRPLDETDAELIERQLGQLGLHHGANG